MFNLSKYKTIERRVDAPEDYILTTNEELFLKYLDKLQSNKQKWTMKSATLALGYRSPNSIMHIIKGLRKKGFIIETRRSLSLSWKRQH
jgi:hypothetical protein